MTRTIAIVQARMGSTRLPGKVLADLAGRPLLGHLLERVRRSNVDEIVVATTTLPADDMLADWVDHSGLASTYRGSADDVLERFYHAAMTYQADLIVRVTADDPLKDAQIINHALALLQDGRVYDYCSNTLVPSYPEGLDIEVFTLAALSAAHLHAQLPSEREHVTPYIWKHPEIFRLYNFSHEKNLSAWRWTVDKPADLEFMRAVFSGMRDNQAMAYRDVISYLEQHPEIQEINQGTVRNEGYARSLAEEKP